MLTIILFLVICMFSVPSNVCAIEAEERVATVIRYATINQDTEIRLKPQITEKPWMALNKGQEVEVMFRNRTRDSLSGKTDYWYEIKFHNPTGHYSSYWIFGGFLDKKRTYTPPWNQIYGEHKMPLDSEELGYLFPRDAYPVRQRLRFYSTENLDEVGYAYFSNHESRRLKIVGRREKGYSLNKNMTGEVFKIAELEDGRLNWKKVQSGYVLAEDIVMFDKTYTSPEGKFKFAEGVLGCWEGYGGCNDLIFKWMILDSTDSYIFLGAQQLPESDFRHSFYYSPKEELLFSNIFNPNQKTLAALYTRAGQVIAASKEYLVSPTWVSSNTIFLRGGTGDDGIYKVNIASMSIEKIFSLEGEGQQPNVGEMYPEWPQVESDSKKNEIKAVFSRPPGGYDYDTGKSNYTEVTVTLDLSGRVLKKESKVVDYTAP